MLPQNGGYEASQPFTPPRGFVLAKAWTAPGRCWTKYGLTKQRIGTTGQVAGRDYPLPGQIARLGGRVAQAWWRKVPRRRPQQALDDPPGPPDRPRQGGAHRPRHLQARAQERLRLMTLILSIVILALGVALCVRGPKRRRPPPARRRRAVFLILPAGLGVALWARPRKGR